MIAVDTNLLVYAHRSSLPEHRRARRALEQASGDPRGWGIALASVAEFWSVVTHRTAPRPSTAREATALLAALGAGAAMQVWVPRVFDLQIALTVEESALGRGLELERAGVAVAEARRAALIRRRAVEPVVDRRAAFLGCVGRGRAAVLLAVAAGSRAACSLAQAALDS